MKNKDEIDIKDPLTDKEKIDNQKECLIDSAILKEIEIDQVLIDSLNKKMNKFYQFYVLEKTSKRNKYITINFEEIIKSVFFAISSKNQKNPQWMIHCAASLRLLLYIFNENRDSFLNICEKYFKENNLDFQIESKRKIVKEIWVYIHFFSGMLHHDFNNIKEKMEYSFKNLDNDNNSELNDKKFIKIVKNFLFKLNNFF